MQLGVLAVPSTYTKGFDLSIKGKSVKKASRMFSPPQAKVNGRLQIARWGCGSRCRVSAAKQTWRPGQGA